MPTLDRFNLSLRSQLSLRLSALAKALRSCESLLTISWTRRSAAAWVFRELSGLERSAPTLAAASIFAASRSIRLASCQMSSAATTTYPWLANSANRNELSVRLPPNRERRKRPEVLTRASKALRPSCRRPGAAPSWSRSSLPLTSRQLRPHSPCPACSRPDTRRQQAPYGACLQDPQRLKNRGCQNPLRSVHWFSEAALTERSCCPFAG